MTTDENVEVCTLGGRRAERGEEGEERERGDRGEERRREKRGEEEEHKRSSSRYNKN